MRRGKDLVVLCTSLYLTLEAFALPIGEVKSGYDKFRITLVTN